MAAVTLAMCLAMLAIPASALAEEGRPAPEVTSISFEPAQAMELVEGIDGYWTNDESGQEYFEYEPKYSAGDVLTVVKDDGSTTAYAYDADAGAFVSQGGKPARISSDDLSHDSDQDGASWGFGQHVIELSYDGASTTVPVTTVPFADGIALEKTPLAVGAPIQVAPGEGRAYYAFTPRDDGYYRFYSAANVDADPVVKVCSVTGEEIGGDDDSAEGNDFSCVCKLDGGSLYYVEVGDYNRTGSYTLNVESLRSPVSISATVKAGASLVIGNDDQGGYDYDDEDLEQGGAYFAFTPEAVAAILDVQATYEDGLTEKLEITGSQIGEFDCRDWEAGHSYEVTVSYLGATCTVEVPVTENPIESIEFTPAQPCRYYENAGGYQRGDGSYDYDDPQFHAGDTLTINEGGVSTAYVYDADEECFASADGASILGDRVKVRTGQDTTPWKLGDDNSFTVTYRGVSTQVPVSIVSNPVKSVSLDPVHPYQVVEDDEDYGETELNPDDEECFSYYRPTFQAGDRLTVGYVDGTSKEFTFTAGKEGNEETQSWGAFDADEGTWTCGGEELDYRLLVTASDQEDKPWRLGEGNRYTLEYFGAQCQVPVSVVKVKVADIAGATVTAAAATYTGKALTPDVAVTLDGKTLKAGTDYDVAYADNVNAGTATATVTGKGAYTGTAAGTFAIAKAKNTVKAKGKTVSVKAKDVKKKAKKVSAKKAFKVSKAQGKVTYEKASGNKKIAVSKSGKVTVKKGLKKGAYKVKVKVTAAGNGNYKKATKTVTLKIKVK